MKQKQNSASPHKIYFKITQGLKTFSNFPILVH